MLKKPYTVGLVGARGYVGREMLRLLNNEECFDVVLATSREHAGRRVSDVFGGICGELSFSQMEPSQVAVAGCDVVVLGLPNGLAAPYVDAIEKLAPSTLIIDLSADYRHKTGWVFGLSDLTADSIVGAKRIANPGCYATAAILGLYPIRDFLLGTPSVFGVSGYSGAGTTPSPKNDPIRLADNILPYGFTGHLHQAEIGVSIGRSVRFMPHVAAFFRGLMTTISVPVNDDATADKVNARLTETYRENATVSVQPDPPELQDVVETPNAVIGGVSIDSETRMLAVSCVHDNLLKGAASQALANIKISLGL